MRNSYSFLAVVVDLWPLEGRKVSNLWPTSLQGSMVWHEHGTYLRVTDIAILSEMSIVNTLHWKWSDFVRNLQNKNNWNNHFNYSYSANLTISICPFPTQGVDIAHFWQNGNISECRVRFHVKSWTDHDTVKSWTVVSKSMTVQIFKSTLSRKLESKSESTPFRNCQNPLWKNCLHPCLLMCKQFHL